MFEQKKMAEDISICTHFTHQLCSL